MYMSWIAVSNSPLTSLLQLTFTNGLQSVTYFYSRPVIPVIPQEIDLGAREFVLLNVDYLVVC